VALRGYSRRLESETAALREQIQRQEEEIRAETEERVRCQRFIETALRSQLVLQKKLETVVYYCDKDVDLTAVSILDVTPDYLDNLLHDLRSDMLPQGGAGKPGRFDFSALEHKQRNIDHQQNQALNSIRYASASILGDLNVGYFILRRPMQCTRGEDAQGAAQEQEAHSRAAGRHPHLRGAPRSRRSPARAPRPGCA
jgi:hypothetical protein